MSLTMRILLVMLVASFAVFATSNVATTWIAFNEAQSLKITKSGVTQLNCRSRVVNDAEDEFRHQIGKGFDAAERRNPQALAEATKAILNAKRTVDQIRDICGAAAVADVTTTTKGG